MSAKICFLVQRGVAESEMSRADRRYGLYASRTRGIWISMPEVIARAPEGWKNEHLNNVGTEAEDGKEDRDISLS